MNIRGLKKFYDDIEFLYYCKQFDIISFQETWQTSINEFHDMLPGFINFDSPRKQLKKKQRGSGGVTVFVKSSIIEQELLKRIYIE